MGSGGGTGQFMKGLQIGIMVKVGLAFLPLILSKLKAHSAASAGYAKAYASEQRSSKQDITDPNVIARNIQRSKFKKLNSLMPASLSRRERRGTGGVRFAGTQAGLQQFVPDEQMNVGFGFAGYQNMLHHYYGSLGGRNR